MKRQRTSGRVARGDNNIDSRNSINTVIWKQQELNYFGSHEVINIFAQKNDYTVLECL